MKRVILRYPICLRCRIYSLVSQTLLSPEHSTRSSPITISTLVLGPETQGQGHEVPTVEGRSKLKVSEVR